MEGIFYILSILLILSVLINGTALKSALCLDGTKRVEPVTPISRLHGVVTVTGSKLHNQPQPNLWRSWSFYLSISVT